MRKIHAKHGPVYVCVFEYLPNAVSVLRELVKKFQFVSELYSSTFIFEVKKPVKGMVYGAAKFPGVCVHSASPFSLSCHTKTTASIYAHQGGHHSSERAVI
jgi:hypothetical protein